MFAHVLRWLQHPVARRDDPAGPRHHRTPARPGRPGSVDAIRSGTALAAATVVLALLLPVLARTPLLHAQEKAAPTSNSGPGARPELVLLVGHRWFVRAAAFSPDGKTLATGAPDGRIILWEVATGAIRRVLTTAPDEIWTLAWSPDGRLLVSACPGHPNTIRFWNPQTGALLRTLPNSATSVAFSPDGKILASGSEDTVTLWDAQTGNSLRELAGQARAVQSLAFSPEGQRLAVAGRQWDTRGTGEVSVWDLRTGGAQWRETLPEGTGGLNSVAFSPNGHTIAAGEYRSGKIRLWDAQTGAPQGTPFGHDGGGVFLAFSPDAQTLASGAGTLRLWDARTGALLKILQDPKDDRGVSAIAVSPDGRLLATGTGEGPVKLWDAQTGELRRTLGWYDRITSLSLSPDGKLMAVAADREPRLRVWDAQTGVLKWIPHGRAAGISSLAFSQDGKLLESAGHDGFLTTWDIPSRTEQNSFPDQPGYDSGVLSPNGRMLARASHAHRQLTFWDAHTGEPLQMLPGPGHFGYPRVAFSPDGHMVAVCSTPDPLEDGKPVEIQVWETETWRLLRTLNGHTGVINGIVFSPDSKLLACGSWSEVHLWSVETGELRMTLQPGANGNLAFSPDGKVLAIPSNDTVRFWHVATGLPWRSLKPVPLLIDRIAFSSDGRRLVSSGFDGMIKIWDVSPDRLLATLLMLPPDQPDQPAGDWIAFTPDGYYDASPGAARFIRWQVGPDLYPAEAYERTFHRPDLLRRALASGPSAPAPPPQQIAAAPAIPPQVSFTRPHDGQTISGDAVQVEVAVTDARSSVHVEVRVNGRPVTLKPITVGGKPIAVGAKPLTVGAKSIALPGQPLSAGAKPITVGSKPLPAAHRFVHHLTAEVPLPPGESQVTLKAVATDGDALQGWDELHLRRPLAAAAGAAAPAVGDLHVLAIGVSRYQNPRYNLNYAAADASAFAGLWQRMEGTLYEHVRVTPLLDGQATAEKIQSELVKLLRTVTRRDSVALFLSGHGVQASEGQFYFAPHEIDATTPERVKATGLPWTVFETILAKLDAKRVFLFLDACHSGSALGEQQASSERLAEALARRGNVLVFSSSRAGEASYEDASLGHGAFTAALLEGIAQGKADLEIGGKRDGRITAEELLAYLRTRVPQMTQNRQTPTCPLIFDFGEQFLLARAR